MEEWRKGLKNKPFNYWIRDEMEAIIKEKNIDRSRFHEYSKSNYYEVIKAFYYTFVDYENHPEISLAYCWLHFREKLRKTELANELSDDWPLLLKKIKIWVSNSKDKEFYLILSQGWVYEGYIDEIISVLNETDGLLEDFYIVSPKYEWFIFYCDDGGYVCHFCK